ncbi:alkyl/aryl-sulfatase [Litorimonas sp. WD9-15]|uniref:alkyl/aryl-sulfatase n=1 Tax=Litorimonas sp. WD9-15 TaxID=3418716 RepID=UPI003D002E82
MLRTLLLGSTLILVACGSPTPQNENPSTAVIPAAPAPGFVSASTKSANDDLAKRLPLSDQQDFEDASRGFLAAITAPAIRDDAGNPVWEIAQYDFVQGPAPQSVNPSLWRQGELVAKHGLFEVSPGLYQIRGYDLSVMTLIEGNTGWIIIDPLTNVETAKAALKLANDTLGERPVSAMLYTHSHADHFGGAKGILPDGAGDVPVIAPQHFSNEAVSENVLAGNHMTRRATLMFGSTLPRSATGHVSSGLGPGLPRGNVSLILPTEELGAGITKKTIDGIQFEFMDMGGTEAPSEFVFYLPDFKALHTAEVVSGTFHNVLTLRGAKSRNTLAWSQGIDAMLAEYGAKSEITLASHHWPKWGTESVQTHLKNQRDIYHYVHDATLRAANGGAGMVEAAEAMEEPEFLSEDFGARGYYGTLNHNSKAVYQHYFGWWSGVPADYHKLPPEQSSVKYVAAMGGTNAVLRTGIEAFETGDYRWAAEVLNHLIFAKEGGQPAKDWLAATYEQMGYQAESGAWRSYYLTGAQELRVGLVARNATNPGSADVLRSVPTRTLLDAMAVRFDGSKVSKTPKSINFIFTDTDEVFTVEVNRSTALARPSLSDNPAVTLTLTRTAFNKLLGQQAEFADLMKTGEIKLDGNPLAARDYLTALETPELWFNIVEP